MKASRLALLVAPVLLLRPPTSDAQVGLLWDTSAASGVQGGTGNWLAANNWNNILPGNNVAWIDGLLAVFNATAGTVTVNGPVTANGLIFNVSGYTVTGSSTLTLGGTAPAINIPNAGQWALIDTVLAGTGGLTKNGAGDLLLRGPTSTYSGPTVINAGRIFVTTNPLGHVLPLGTPVVIANAPGVSLVFEFANAQLGSLSGGGTAGGSLILEDPSFLSVGSDNTSTTFAGVITATGTVVKTGTGALELTNNGNSFAKTISISNGTLRVPRLSTSIGSDPLGPVPAISLGGTLSVTQGGSKQINLFLGGGTIEVPQAASQLAITGSLTGFGGFTKSGPGTLRLIGTGTYSGPTIIAGGTLDATSGDPISAASTVTLSNTNGVRLLLDRDSIGGLEGGGLNGGDVILQGANPTLTVGANGSSTTYGGIISGAGGSLVKTGTGTLTFTFINTFTGDVTIENGALSLSTVTNAGTSGVLGAGSAVTLGGIGTAGRLLFTSTAADSTNRAINLSPSGGTIEVNAATGALTCSGPVSGNGGLAKAGPGTLILTGSNTYSGPTVVAAGKLHVSGGSAIGDGSAVSVANSAGAMFELLSGNETAGSLAGGGANGGTVALGNNTLTVGGDATFTTFAGVITGGGGLTKTGPGTMTLSGVNTFTGVTTVSAGTLRLAGGEAITDASAVFVAPGATLDLNGTNEFIGSLNGSGTVLLGGATLTLGADGSPMVFDGVISGSGGLTMTGTGTLTLSGASNFTGPTSVTAGTVVLDNGLGTPGGALSVGAGATVQARDVVNRPISGAGTIAATGTLFLGDFDATSGVAFAGTLAVGTNAVFLADADIADLGTATTLGAGGRLYSLNGAAIGSGESVTVAPSASASISGAFINNGTVHGPTAAGQSLTFTDDASGAGNYTGNVTFSDGFSPGMSAAAVSLENFTFDGTTTLNVEIGGLAAGTQYDRLNVSGTAALNGELSVSLINGFNPQAGNTFTFIQGGVLSGAFAGMKLPPLDPGLAWQYAQTSSAATLTVVSTLPVDLRIVSTARLPNGHIQLTCLGAPGLINRVEAVASLTPAPTAWTTAASITADPDGTFTFTDTAAPGFPARFYRLAYP